MPRGPDDVQQALKDLGLQIQIQTFDSSTATSQQAADVLETELGSIAKSICMTAGEQALIVVAAGDIRVDDRKIAELCGASRRKTRMANHETTLELTGYEVGGVPPIGLPDGLRLIIDESLSRFETVHAAAGASDSVFSIPYAQLVEISGGEVAAVAKE